MKNKRVIKTPKRYFAGLANMAGAMGKAGGMMSGASNIGGVAAQAVGLYGSVMGDEKASKVANVLNNVSGTLGTMGGSFNKYAQNQPDLKQPGEETVGAETEFDENKGYRFGRSASNMYAKYGMRFTGNGRADVKKVPKKKVCFKK